MEGILKKDVLDVKMETGLNGCTVSCVLLNKITCDMIKQLIRRGECIGAIRVEKLIGRKYRVWSDSGHMCE